jgi:phospholipase C
MFVMPLEAINAIRNSPSWQDSVIFITYAEHGGSYDHVRSPHARQGGQRNPDGIIPFLDLQSLYLLLRRAKAMHGPT